MMFRTRREWVESFALEMGVSIGYAHEWLRRQIADDAKWGEIDARLKANAALAELEAARSITEQDVQELAEYGEPEEDLDFLIRHRSNQLLRHGVVS